MTFHNKIQNDNSNKIVDYTIINILVIKSNNNSEKLEMKRGTDKLINK